MVSGILLLTYYKNYDFFHNHVSQAAVLSLFLKKMMLDFSTFSKHIE